MSESTPKIERSLRVCIPAYKGLETGTVQSLFALREHIPFALDMVGVAEVAVARSMLAERALASNQDVVLWLDADMVFHPQHFFTLHEALENNKNMGLISALAVRRDGSNLFCVNWRQGRKGWTPQDEAQARSLRYLEDEEHPIRPADVTGLAFTVMFTDVLKHIKAPWFQPAWITNTRKNEEGQPEYLFFGEDSSFMKRLQARGYQPSVHYGVHVGHIGEQIYVPPPPPSIRKQMEEENGEQLGLPDENQDSAPDGSEDPSG